MSNIQPIEQGPFDIVKVARQALKSRNEQKAKYVQEIRHGSVFSPASQSTIDQYYRSTIAIFASDDPWSKAATTKKVKTWQKRKSAMLYVAANEATILLKKQDDMQRRGAADPKNIEHDEWKATVKRVEFFSNILKTQPKDTLLKEVKQKASKRKLTGLPENWRMELLSNITYGWKSIYLVQAVTGCRPAEIAKGIKLQFKDGKLTAAVEGAKLGQFSGQKLRSMVWDVENPSPLVAELIKLVPDNGVWTTINYSKISSSNPASAYSTAVRDAGKRAFPKRPGTMTPYSLRHAAASDLKDSDLSSEEQSKALGHQVTETKSVYGSKVYGKRAGSVAPESVKASTKVRTKTPTNAAKAMTAKIKGTSRPKLSK